MILPKFDDTQIFTLPTIYSLSQWVPFSFYQWLPHFPRYAPDPFMLSPTTFFRIYIAWHSRYQTVFPHSTRYRLQRSIATGNFEQAIKIFEKGFPIDQAIDLKYGYNSLQIATINNQYTLMEMLLLRGANVNQQDQFGNTPLHFAIVNQNHEAIHTLVKNGCDPWKKNKYGVSAMDKAHNMPHIVEFIQNMAQQTRKFPKFRVKLRFQQLIESPFWKQIREMKVYTGKVTEHLTSKWQFDFTNNAPLAQLLQQKGINDIYFTQ